MPTPEFFSMIDFGKFEEELSTAFDPTADANANLDSDPVPAGDYVLKVKVRDAENELRWEQKLTQYDKKPREYFSCMLVGTIVDGLHQGRRLRFRVSTHRRKSPKCSTVEELLDALGVRVDAPRTQKKQMRLLTKALAESPSCVASIDWRAWDSDPALQKELRRYRTMTRFPDDGNGNFIPEVELSDGTIARAYNYVRKWKPLPDETLDG